MPSMLWHEEQYQKKSRTSSFLRWHNGACFEHIGWHVSSRLTGTARPQERRHDRKSGGNIDQDAEPFGKS